MILQVKTTKLKRRQIRGRSAYRDTNATDSFAAEENASWNRSPNIPPPHHRYFRIFRYRFLPIQELFDF
jgi:hypothetical protein